MARVRSVDFLPEIFKTPTNKQFLNSTLDQLIQEPKLKQTQGYIGRKTAPGKRATDGYVLEPTNERVNYQLEPGVTFKDNDGKIVDALSYIGLIDGLATNGAITNNHDRLFRSEAYAWSPYVDFDKLVNYNQYFWLPAGPDSVDVAATDVSLTNEFDVTVNTNTLSISGFKVENPVITLVRGGSYEFAVDTIDAPFYIQSQPGVGGTLPWASNISSRDVYGVTNNGADQGVITFNVPQANAQDFYFTLTDIGAVDLAYDGPMDDIADKPVSEVPDINGIQDYNNKTIIFIDPQPGDAVDLGWVNDGVPLVTNEERYQIFRIDTTGGTVKLLSLTAVNELEKLTIQYGEEYSNVEFLKDALGYFARIPLTTAPLDTLYYQDASNPDRFGVINIIEQDATAFLDVSDIIGRETYTSPNGVVFTNGLKVQLRGTIIPAEYIDGEYYVDGVGDSIRLVDSNELIVPEKYTESSSAPWDIKPYDKEGWDGTLNAPLSQDYITINRSSIDRNAWSRSNRWFHIDVILAAAEYNNVTAELNNDNRATRPIIEFDRDLRLLNYGTKGKISVNVIDFTETDALSNINEQLGYFIDGFKLEEGSRVIFANDADPEVRNKIFVVELIDPDNNGVDTINLVLAEDALNEEDNVIVIRSGNNQQGTALTYTNGQWVESQQKIAVNQAPLFDIFDINGNSFNDASLYPSTSFNGTKLFSYAEGTGSSDLVLGFPLKYLNIDNLGDIVFENNFYTDTFLYVLDNATNEDTPVSNGFARKYYTREDFTSEIGWVTAKEETRQAQIFNIDKYESGPVELDILPAQDLNIPAVRVSINSSFLNPKNYTVGGNVITFISGVTVGDEIEIKVISDEVSKIAYYDVPANLQSNIFNENTDELTLGTIRNHYNALAQNITAISGNINGANNSRDLGDISVYGNLIVQQSAPVALAAMFMRQKEYNFFNALKFSSRYYEKLKFQLIDWVANNDIFEMSLGKIVDTAITDINAGKNLESSFYWSDMMVTGNDYESTHYVITAISTNTFSSLHAYDFTKANTHGLLVYHNDRLLLKDSDYTVEVDAPRITLLFDTEIDDTIRIDEYSNTIGSNIPSTPTKLGLYPKFRPLKYLDDTYATPTEVIRGHDGSIIVAQGDITDDILLEFETRIYNNIKVNSDIPLQLRDIIPGVFRDTEYSELELLEIFSAHTLSWLGWNRIDHKSQDYKKAEEKTWNYSSTQLKLGDLKPDGNWRGLYKQFYDTDSPHRRPWEMLGLFERPAWWELRYGPAPYTSGNLVLWDDMEAGLLAEPGNERVLEQFVRPGLTQVLPVDGEGILLTPLDAVVENYTAYDFKKSWQLGDEGPAESAWHKSSAYPFAVQAMYAVTKPAIYFSLMADRDRYTYNEDIGQYLYDGRHRIDARNIEIPDDNIVKHSYINWIVDYNKHYGFNSVDKLKEDLSNLGVNLVHHMASYTDKNNLKIFTDKSSPDSTNSSLLLPDESFNLLLYKNQPFDTVQYSSVVVQKLDEGYAVIGNSTNDPYFKYYPANATGRFKDIKVGRTQASETTVRIPLDFEEEVQFIPYGFTLNSKHSVASFLIGYGEYLERAGLVFGDMQDDIEINWEQMVQEFIYWADEGWSTGSVINLNPAASVLEFEREGHIVNNLNDLDANEQPLDQNREPLKASQYAIDRLENNFKLILLNDSVVSHLKVELINFEHLLVLDNVSIFDDLIYDPVTGVRQHRVKLSGFTTYEWNGQLDAQGFMYNEDNVQEYSSSTTYNRGDIVKFKNTYWSASKKAQPSDVFDFNTWVKTDYGKISTGLLPNLATKSTQQLDFYNNKTANLESDVDLMALGLTGYRTRDYLQSLDLDDISQVNIYSDMIQSKGTFDGLNLFQGATLNNEVADYQIYENWAILRARYGATASRAHAEFNLDGTKHNSNPSILEIVDSLNEEVIGDDIITVDNIFKQSVKHTSKNILPLQTNKDLDTSLLTAGAVDPDDVDIQVFDINSLQVDADISDGTTVWVAKDSEIDWNVYTALDIDARVIRVLDNLDGTLRVVFDKPHTLLVNGILIIKDFDDQLNGAHIVFAESTATELLITGELLQNQTIIEDKEGPALKLDSSRLRVPSDIAGSRFDNLLFSDDTVWIDTTNGRTATYKKEDPFTLVRDEVTPITSDTGFGQSISQGYDGHGMIVGAPKYKTQGGVFCYNRTGLDYILDQELKLNSDPNAANYGHAVELRKEWAIASAPGNGTTIPGLVSVISRSKQFDYFNEERVIVSPHHASSVDLTSDFGTAIALSDDENWAYVSEPKLDEVHAYQQVPYQLQELRTTIQEYGVSQIKVDDNIIVDTAEQLQIFVNEVQLTAFDYAYNGTYVIFFITLEPEDRVEILRRNAVAYDGDGATVAFSVSSLYAVDGAESVRVTLNSIIQRPYIDYNLVGSDIVFTAPPPASTNNVILGLSTYYQHVTTLVGTAGENFGQKIDVTTDSSHIAITAPNATVGALTNAGKVYIYDRVVERFVVEDELQTVYTTTNLPINSSNIFVNGQIQVRKDYNINGNYDIDGFEVTVDVGTLIAGDFLDVDTNEFTIIQTCNAVTPEVDATFGNAVSICKSKCSIYVGAVGANEGQGNVERLVNRTRMFGITQSDTPTPSMSVGDTIRINNVEVELKTEDLTNELNEVLTIAGAIAKAIIRTIIPNVTASAVDYVTPITGVIIKKSILTIELINKQIKSIANKLDVAAGTGINLEIDLGLQTYYHGQVLTSPIDTVQPQHFGQAVHIDRNLNQLVVSAITGYQYHVKVPNTADADTSTADSINESADDISRHVAEVISTDDNNYTVDNSEVTTDGAGYGPGVVYTYDLLPDATEFSEGKLVLGQQITAKDVDYHDNFGNAVNLVDNILVVASVDYSDTGRILIYSNPTGKLSWSASAVQKDVVDTALFNSVFFYDKQTQDVTQYLDYIDPLNGKLLGVASENLDFITAYNPATYEGQFNGLLWGEPQVDQMWWDLSTVRFIDYNLGDAKKAAKLWGKTFPGSAVDIYQWTESDVTPEFYTGSGTVAVDEPFITNSTVDKAGKIISKFYYWIKNVAQISVNSNKTLSADAVSQYILSPVSSGISYIAAIAPNQVAFYNCKELIDEDETILHIEYDKVKNDNNVFVEYDLFRENRPDEFLSDLVYRKLQDSFCGVDTLGNLVPDIGLNEQDRFGIDFRPRKSMFVDRFAALKNYLQKVNKILLTDTFAEAVDYALLNTEEPQPTELAGAWDEKLADYEELTFQDLTLVPEGYKYLVESDAASRGLWTIYEVTEAADATLIRVQNYDTKRYWETITWYDESFNEFTRIDYVVDNFTLLATLNAPEKSIAKVLANGDDKWEIYRLDNGGWFRVALQDGTMQFTNALWDYTVGRFGWDIEVWDTQHFDQEPVIELRFIIRAINEEMLIGDKAIHRNDTMLSVFNYVLAEQPDANWLNKTSLIDVTQNVRSLSQYPIYQKDNQDYLADYLAEAKPYHTKIKDFLLSYDGIDTFEGHVTDFDCPAVYDNEFSRFLSPVLDDGAILTTDPSNKLATDAIWQTEPWNQWFDNYRLVISDVLITNAGSGYTVAPIVEVIGESTTPAQLIARVGSGGSVTEIIIVEAGSGYATTPQIVFSGGNGADAVATPIMDQNLVRSFQTTMKYDRYEYETNVVMWEPETVYEQDQLVRILDTVYKLTSANGVDESPATFDPLLNELVDINELSGIDRTYGYYVSDVNNPGLDLSLLINGIAYPGVEVDGVAFDKDTGFDVAAWDTVVFDNFDVGPEGLPTYSEDLIDTIYESSFFDTYLGTGPTDINVDGGMFIDTYHSHAPEELIPGAIFDTLDIKVTSRPGADYTNDGHGFDMKSKSYTVSSTVAILSFADVVPHPIKLVVVNLTTGTTIYENVDYTLDWTTQTVNVTSGIAISDQVKIFVYEIGGGNQLHRSTLVGSQTIGDTFVIPVRDIEIYEELVYINGVETTVQIDYVSNQTSLVTLPIVVDPDDFISITVFGFSIPQYEESLINVQQFVYGTDVVDPGSAALIDRNKHNAIVEVNGLRLRPPEGVRHLGNGTSTSFVLPLNGGYQYDDIADAEVAVYVNNVELQYTIDFEVSPPSPPPAVFGSGEFGTAFFTTLGGNPIRTVILNFTPDEGDVVDVYVRHMSDYWYAGSELTFVSSPALDDLVAVTTFGDTSQSAVLTEVFVGPTQLAESQQELFDTVGWDVLGFDLEIGINVDVNVFQMSEIHLNANQLWVTLNGERLGAGDAYIISGDSLILTIPTIGVNDVIAVTSFTENTVQNGVNFRLFKDMRDNTGMYKLNKTNTTFLAQEVLIDDDIIYVNDASVLGQPNLAIAKFGIVIINGERITFRELNLINNTISGLRRGTAGTGVHSHAAADVVSDVSSKSFVQLSVPVDELGVWNSMAAYAIDDIVKYSGVYWRAYVTPTTGQFSDTEWSRYDKIWYAPLTQEGDDNAIPLAEQETIPAIFIKN